MMASLQSAKSTTVTLATTPELERQERIAYTVVQELMRMPDPAHGSYMKDAIPSRNIPQLRAVRVVGFDVYDTLIKVGFLRHVSEGTIGSSNLEAIKKAIAYSGLSREELRIEPEHIPELLAALERQAKVPFKVGSETIYPEMDIISNWSKVLGVDDVGRLVRVSTAFEAMRAQYSIMPGADTFLSVLKESGLRIGVISNSQVYTPAILDQMFIRENGTPVRNYFSDPDLMIYSHRTNLEGHRVMKPSRVLFETFYRNAQALIPDLKRDEVLFIGNCQGNDGASTEAGFQFAHSYVDPDKVRLAPETNYPRIEFSSFQALWNWMGLSLT